MRDALVKHLPRAEQWAGQICAQLSKSAEAIIDTGRLLVKAKVDLPHGEWGRMFNDGLVPFSIRSAQMLMAIAEHPAISNTNHGSYLPPSWGTLYELTKVPDRALANAFRDGLITPGMARREVKALLPAHAGPSPAKPRRPVRDTQFEQALDDARAWVVKWGHISALALISDAITAALESFQRKDSDS